MNPFAVDAGALKRRALQHLWFHAAAPVALRQPVGTMIFEKGEGCAALVVAAVFPLCMTPSSRGH
ncbi:MAG: hypothetical protein QM581_07425 [Pseudomonas sp.]